MTLQQNARRRAAEEHRKRNAKALARYNLDSGEPNEVLRELLARAVVTTTAKDRGTHRINICDVIPGVNDV